jgi:hypothetical protein
VDLDGDGSVLHTRSAGMSTRSRKIWWHVHAIQGQHMDVHIQPQRRIRPLDSRHGTRVRVGDAAKPEMLLARRRSER